MKKLSALTFIILVVFISCKKETTLPPPQIEPNPPKEAEIVEPAGDQCYTSRLNGNIVALSFNVNSHQEVNGKLSYNITGKDKNEGTIIGNMKGDTLIADYTFMSEGVSSVREVVFLQKDGTLIEGYGDVVDANNKVTFKDKKKLKFDAKNTLTKSDCPQ
jgi:WD40 repeat protein